MIQVKNISRLYKEISLKSSNWNIAVLQFCTTVQQRESIIPISQFSSDAQSCPTLWDPMDYSMPGFRVHRQLPDPAQTHVQVSDAIQPSHPLLSPSPPALSLTQHQDVSNASVLHIRWSKYWSFSFSISPSNEYSGLISFRIEWCDLLAV